MLKYLLSLGADMNVKDIAGRKPLYYAILNNHTLCAKVLLENLADPWSCTDKDYYSFLDNNSDLKMTLRKFRQVYSLFLNLSFLNNVIVILIQHDLNMKITSFGQRKNITI